MSRYIVAVDQSTTGTKAVLFDEKGNCVARCSLAHRQYYPKQGWVEQDAEEIFENTKKVIGQVLAQAPQGADVLALAITVQTGAFVVWDRETGIPVDHMIGWQCNRGEEFCASLTQAQQKTVLDKSGTEASAFLPAAKLRWMLDHVEGLAERARNGQVLFGTVETWLVWKLTNGKVHASDYCNASITQLFDQNTLDWDQELLEIFGVPKEMLPSLYAADADFGTLEADGLPRLPITGVIGDSAAALFGQCGFKAGDVKVTYGTGASILMNLGPVPQPPAEGMTTSVGWKRANGQVAYVWEGTAMYIGATVAWLVNGLEMLSNAKESEQVAAQAENNGGVYLVPAFSGLGTPYRDSAARACIVGMAAGTKRAHVVRAALESIAYQIRDMVEAMQRKTGQNLTALLADGGVTVNRLLMQFQADVLGVPVFRSTAEEISAQGVFFMAGLSMGLFENEETLMRIVREKERFSPSCGEKDRTLLYEGWKKAIRQARTQ